MTAFAKWRVPTREEYPTGMAALAEHIGEAQSVSPVWTRRLVLSEPDGQWGLTVDSGGKPSSPKLAPWCDPPQVEVTTLACPLSEAVALLSSPANPEAVLEARRQAVREHAAQAEAEKLAKQAEERQREAEARSLAADNQRFDAAGWYKLDPWQMAFYALAIKVAGRDAALADDLRAIAGEGRRGKPAQPAFPRRKWEGP